MIKISNLRTSPVAMMECSEDQSTLLDDAAVADLEVSTVGSGVIVFEDVPIISVLLAIAYDLAVSCARPDEELKISIADKDEIIRLDVAGNRIVRIGTGPILANDIEKDEIPGGISLSDVVFILKNIIKLLDSETVRTLSFDQLIRRISR